MKSGMEPLCRESMGQRPADSPWLVRNRSEECSFVAWHSAFSPAHAHIRDECVQTWRNPSCSQLGLPFSNHIKSSS